MTPKEQYEARKAARKNPHQRAESRDAEVMDMLDRFVTAFERMVETMVRK